MMFIIKFNWRDAVPIGTASSVRKSGQKGTERSMSGVRKAQIYAANTLGLACVAATCFLAACSDDDRNGDPSAEAGRGGRAGAAGATGKAGATIGGSAGDPQGGGGRVAGADTAGGEPGLGGDAGMGGESNEGGAANAGAGGDLTGGGAGGSPAAGGTAGSLAGSAGTGGAPVVAVPNCSRDTSSGKTIAVSATGHDGLFGAAFGPDGFLYATGYVQDGIAATEDRATVVVKINAATG